MSKANYTLAITRWSHKCYQSMKDAGGYKPRVFFHLLRSAKLLFALHDLKTLLEMLPKSTTIDYIQANETKPKCIWFLAQRPKSCWGNSLCWYNTYWCSVLHG